MVGLKIIKVRKFKIIVRRLEVRDCYKFIFWYLVIVIVLVKWIIFSGKCG